MFLFNSDRPDSGWPGAIDTEPNIRIQQVGGWLVFLFWAAGMLAIYFLLLHAGYVESNNSLPADRPSATKVASPGRVNPHPAHGPNAFVFTSTQSYFDFFNDSYAQAELQEALTNALRIYGLIVPSFIKVYPKRDARGLSFEHDFEIML